MLFKFAKVKFLFTGMLFFFCGMGKVHNLA